METRDTATGAGPSPQTPDQQSAKRGLQRAGDGLGALLQRDYWAVIDRCRARPSEIVTAIREAFWTFPPPDIAEFRRADAAATPLQLGDELIVAIRMAGEFAVRVVHLDRVSLTVATLEGHPEAGRITFGAYRNARGDVIAHIRSRARSSCLVHLAGFKSLGDPMQLYCWTDFVNAIAERFGEGVIGFVNAETVPVEDEPGEAHVKPTFIAEAD